MKYSLVVKDEKSGLYLCCKQNGVVVASGCYSGSGHGDSGIKAFLKDFRINPQFITKTILWIDLPAFMDYTGENAETIYVRILPAGMHAIYPIDCGIQDNRPIRRFDVYIDNSEKSAGLSSLLEYLDGHDADRIAINSYFSFRNLQKEESLASLIRERCKESCVIMMGHELYVHNAILRENLLLNNLRLYGTVSRYLGDMASLLKLNGVSAPIFLIKCDGTLYGSRLAVHNPMETWQVDAAALMMDVSYKTGLKDAFVVFRQNGQWTLGMLKTGRPLTTAKPSAYNGSYIPGSFPLLHQLPDICSNQDVLDLIRRSNPYPGPVPVVLAGAGTEQLLQSSEYPVVRVEKEHLIPGSGIDCTVYRREISRYVMDASNQDASRVKQELADTAADELRADGITSKDIEYHFERIPIKYMLEDAYILKVTAVAYV